MSAALDPLLALIDQAFDAEIVRVSTLEYNSNEICRHFYAELRKRIESSLALHPRPEAELPELVDRVALALFLADDCTSADTWYELPDYGKDRFRDRASAAIAAMGQQCVVTSPAGNAVGYVGQDGSVIFYIDDFSYSRQPKAGTELFTRPAEVGGDGELAKWKELASDAIYVGCMIGLDCASALADLQERGVYKPRCEDDKPSNADARKDATRIKEIYRRGLYMLREDRKRTPPAPGSEGGL